MNEKQIHDFLTFTDRLTDLYIFFFSRYINRVLLLKLKNSYYRKERFVEKWKYDILSSFIIH